MKSDQITNFLIAAGAVVGLYLVYRVNQGVEIAAEVISNDLNPASDDNIINRGLGGVLEASTGIDNLGQWIFCKMNPDANTFLCPDGMPGRPVPGQSLTVE